MKPIGIKSFRIIIAILIVFTSFDSFAQYFGQNRPLYKTFNFKVYETPNFEIYHYFDNDSVVQRLAQAAEQWYGMHYQVFGDSIKKKNPLIFYANHADFQQTTAIFGTVGVGTGGVTEALKNRVVLPVTETWAQTDHVLGHELVHAFQFNSILTKDSTNLNSLNNIPLWMVEGMAEYFSIGSIHPHTAMWMRDAVLNNNFPTLEKMSRDNKYFPYRYGHAFCSFVGRTFGDSLIVPILLETAKRGYNIALKRYLGLDEKEFSNIWKRTSVEHFKMVMKDTIDTPAGRRLFDQHNAGYINISPAISPDGKYVAFYSEKDLFSIDLFLAETATGRIIQKLSSTIHRNEIDALNFIESAGAWSPDSRLFAFVAFSKGRNRLLVVDVERNKLRYEIEIPKVPSFNYPVWSPDGRSIVVSGLVDGVNDLYQYNIETKQTKRLTNDSYANVHPTWSPDGSAITFVTDRPSLQDIHTKRMPGYYLATLDLKTGKTKTHHFFPGAANLNPIYAPDGKSIYFLSDRDGFRNLYQFELETTKIFQKTKILTGISGMTELAPAFSAATKSGTMAYSYYFDSKYLIYIASPDDLISEEVFPMAIDYTAATLPPFNRAATAIVDRNIGKRMGQPETSVDSFRVVKYRPKFKLDYIANSGVGVSSSQMGTGMAGAVEMIFSDIVGANLLHIGLALNGEIYDFGGQFTYINQKNRVIWGASVSHVPYSYAQIGLTRGAWVDQYTFVDTLSYYHIRRFETMIGGMAQFPLSKSQRLEAGAYLNWYNFRVDIHNYQRINNYYYSYYWREKGDAPDGFALQRLNMAYVVDNSSFGIASPMDGARHRIQVDKVFGDINFWGGLIDLRKYIFIKPISLAFKGYYYGRYGSGLDNIYPLYLGYPWVIRGYENNAFTNYSSNYGPLTMYPEQLTGNQMATLNFEVRMPFTGPERLSRIKSKYFYTELALFADAGLAFYDFKDVVFRWKPPVIDPNIPESYNKRFPVVSAGVSLRVNVFGMLILEPYYAIPFQIGGGKYGLFGLNFMPGW